MARTSASSCSATARSLAGKVQLAHRARRRVCVKRQPAGVLRTTRSGSPEDTDLERISPGGPRIKHLCDLFVIESGARSRLRTRQHRLPTPWRTRNRESVLRDEHHVIRSVPLRMVERRVVHTGSPSRALSGSRRGPSRSPPELQTMHASPASRGFSYWTSEATGSRREAPR